MKLRRALVCAPLMPEYDKESGGQSILDLILFLREAGWAVSFACENPANGTRYRRLLQQKGVAVYEGYGEHLDELIAYGKLDLAICCFWYIGEQLIRKIRVNSPTTRIVINTMDVHFLRNGRKLTAGGSSATDGAVFTENGWGDEAARELGTYAAADAVFCVSPKEAAWLSELLGRVTPAHVVTDYEHLAPSPYPMEERSGILFVGNFRHPPNVEAVQFLCDEIVPRLDRQLLEKHPVYVVGTDLSSRVRKFAEGVHGVNMVGWVPTLTPYYHGARVGIAPLLHGGGTKRKVLQALTAGLPIVSTSTGVEGFNLKAGQDILVADDPETFAQAITRLVSDQRLWRRLAQRGQAAVKTGFDREVVGRRYLKVVDDVLARPAKRVELTREELTADGPAGYARLLQRINSVVQAQLPAGARVAVVSKGDERLLEIPGIDACHFPQVDGEYAGYYPQDSDDAVAQLEQLRSQGIDYLLLPRTSLWWLDYYDGLRAHLGDRYEEAVSLDDTCKIFALTTR